MEKHSTESLQKLSMPDLRNLAKKYKIVVAGKRPADMIREILKKQANAAGKGTAADPKSGSKKTKVNPKASKKSASIELDDEEEVKMPKKKTASKTVATKTALKSKKGVTKTKPTKVAKKATPPWESVGADVLEVLRQVAEWCEIEGLPTSLGGKTKSKAEEPDEDEDDAEEEEVDEDEEEEDEEEVAEDEDEEEEEEESDEEEEEEDEEAVDEDDSDEDESDEEEEEEDEDEEEVREVEISKEQVMKATLSELIAIGNTINDAAGEELVDVSTKKQIILRNQILKVLKDNESGETEVDDDDEPKKGDAAPGWLKKGTRVKAKYEGAWYTGTIGKVGKKLAEVEFDEDESVSDVPFGDIKPLKKKAG